MTVVFPGDSVLELIRSATDRVIIAAPYIKSSALCRLLEPLSNSVPEFTCITRWLPEDIASGACDLEILDDVARVRGASLMVHPHLHAKYYSNGRQCLVGSANLTAHGLGWHTPSNIELLVMLSADFPGLPEWEQILLSSSVTATEQLRDQIRVQVEKLRRVGTLIPALEARDTPVEDEEEKLWFPRCPVPERLWEVYCGRGVDSMVSSALEAAQKDLGSLSLPPGLTQEFFMAYVSGILQKMPLFIEIDKLAESGLTDAKAYDFLADSLAGKNDNKQVWLVVKQWLVFFFPNSYRLETRQEALVKGRQIPSR